MIEQKIFNLTSPSWKNKSLTCPALIVLLQIYNITNKRFRNRCLCLADNCYCYKKKYYCPSGVKLYTKTTSAPPPMSSRAYSANLVLSGFLFFDYLSATSHRV